MSVTFSQLNSMSNAEFNKTSQEYASKLERKQQLSFDKLSKGDKIAVMLGNAKLTEFGASYQAGGPDIKPDSVGVHTYGEGGYRGRGIDPEKYIDL